MEMLIVLLPATIFIALVFLFGFFWAVKSGQYDDIETPAYKILIDDNNDITQQQNYKGTGNGRNEKY